MNMAHHDLGATMFVNYTLEQMNVKGLRDLKWFRNCNGSKM